jgi:hypothetical protein
LFSICKKKTVWPGLKKKPHRLARTETPLLSLLKNVKKKKKDPARRL